jgi:hypothetical protein
VYTVLPSIITSSLFASSVLNPRALIAQSCEFLRATSRLLASRSASGMLVAPERRMSSPVMTCIADAARASFSGRRDTDITSISISSSRLMRLSNSGDNASSDRAAAGAVIDSSAIAVARTPASSASRHLLGRGFAKKNRVKAPPR